MKLLCGGCFYNHDLFMCHYEAVGLVLCFALPFGVNNESTLTKIYNVARVSVCTILLLEPSKLSFVLDYILVVVLPIYFKF